MGGMKANARINQNKKQTKTVLARVGWYHKNAEVELFCSISYNFKLLEILKFICILKEIDIEQNKRPPRRNWANKGEREGELKKWCLVNLGSITGVLDGGRSQDGTLSHRTTVVHLSYIYPCVQLFMKGVIKKRKIPIHFTKQTVFFL